MKIRARWKHLAIVSAFLPLLAGAAWAQSYRSAPQPPQPSFNSTIHWEAVPGTRVYMIRQGERPPYDLFSFGSQYYMYDSGYWYRSPRVDGRYMAIDVSEVPSDLYDVPRGEWMTYPSGWSDETSNSFRDDWRATHPGQTRVYFDTTPNWVMVQGTRVAMVRSDQRPSDYDLFSYNGRYYMYSDDRNWYRADRLNGDFIRIDEGNVPMEISRVPQTMWVRYPAQWANQQNNRNDRYDRDYRSSRIPAAPRIYFNRPPHWVRVPGTSVAVVRSDERPRYDFFRYGSSYYIFNNGYWYRSRSWHGPFTAINDRYVPVAFESVPERWWQQYPSAYYGGYRGH